MMAVMAGFTVANLYYNQPLLDMICRETGIKQVEANLITVITQIGYALGLLFIVPLADMVSVRRIVVLGMSVAAVSAVVIGCADSVWLLWGGSLALGISSIMPQLFIPMATLYSRPKNKTRNMGYVASGLLTGILSARAVSGYVGLIMAIILADIGAQCLQVSNQSSSLRQLPEATNRVNTIFMTTFFIGGSLGTFFSGLGWSMAGWLGVCLVGGFFACASLLLSAYERFYYH